MSKGNLYQNPFPADNFIKYKTKQTQDLSLQDLTRHKILLIFRLYCKVIVTLPGLVITMTLQYL